VLLLLLLEVCLRICWRHLYPAALLLLLLLPLLLVALVLICKSSST
jgi:hypothetical protein